MIHNPIIAALLLFLVVVLVAGFVAWMIRVLFPADGPYKTIGLGVIAAIVVVIFLVLAYGALTGHAAFG